MDFYLPYSNNSEVFWLFFKTLLQFLQKSTNFSKEFLEQTI